MTTGLGSLQKRAGELAGRIDRARSAMAEALAAGKDTAKLAAEIAQLEAERAAIPAAMELVKQQEAEQAEAERAKARAGVVAEIEELNSRADKMAYDLITNIASLQAGLDEYKALTNRIESLRHDHHLLMPNRFRDLGAGVIPAVQEAFFNIKIALQKLRELRPELFGLPPLPSPEEQAIREAERSVETCRRNLETLQTARKGGRGEISPNQIYNAEQNLEEAERRLAKLKKEYSL